MRGFSLLAILPSQVAWSVAGRLLHRQWLREARAARHEVGA